MVSNQREIAVLGGGCFWCVEAVYRDMRGVIEVVSGYAGGHVVQPTYEAVCSKTTGHAEVVRVTFDPREMPFDRLLDIFFTLHDPTTLNRQGHDVGPQYRSVVFCQNAVQQAVLRQAIERLTASGELPGPVVTEIAGPAVFYAAESYHQDYFRRHGHEPYCSAVIAPKVAKCRRLFAAQLRY